MADPVQNGGGDGAKIAVKISLAVLGAGLALGLLSVILRLALKVHVSFLGVIGGWLVFLGIILTAISGLVLLLVRRTSAPPAAAVRYPTGTAGMAPGWYPDQNDPDLMRWFDGRNWTSGTAPRN